MADPELRNPFESMKPQKLPNPFESEKRPVGHETEKLENETEKIVKDEPYYMAHPFEPYEQPSANPFENVQLDDELEGDVGNKCLMPNDFAAEGFGKPMDMTPASDSLIEKVEVEFNQQHLLNNESIPKLATYEELAYAIDNEKLQAVLQYFQDIKKDNPRMPDVPKSPLEYVTFAFKNPKYLNHLENQAAKRQKKSNPNWKQILEWSIDTRTTLENARNPRHHRKDLQSYKELTEPTYIFSGDYFPGTEFVLGDSETYYREKFTMNKAHDAVKDLLVFARETAVKYEHRDEIAYAIYGKVLGLFKSEQDYEGYAGNSLEAGDALDNERGVCRHRAVVLQSALQETGRINSRVVRGKFITGGLHAWVIADFIKKSEEPGEEDTVEQWFYDPMKKEFGPTDSKEYKTCFKTPEEDKLKVWRRKGF